MHRTAFEFAVNQLNEDDAQVTWKSVVDTIDSPDSLTAYKRSQYKCTLEYKFNAMVCSQM